MLNFNGTTLDPTHITGFDIDATSGVNYEQAFIVAAPEPASLTLLGLGLAGLGIARRRRSA